MKSGSKRYPGRKNSMFKSPKIGKSQESEEKRGQWFGA